MTAVTVVIVLKKLPTSQKKQQKKLFFLSIFGKSNLTHLTTDVMFSGQRFAIIAMFESQINFCHKIY